MSDFDKIVDEAIRDAMAAGNFRNLPGEGKPLKLEDDTLTPDHLRMAHKILRDNDLAPDWILDGKDLEAMHEGMMKKLRRAAKHFRHSLSEDADAEWFKAKRQFVDAVTVYNRKVLTYNLKVPPGVTHRITINPEREIRRALDEA